MSEHVRDGRKGRFWMDDDVLDRYGSELGAYGIAVYTMLCRRADKNGASYPSLKRMSEDLAISERQAKRELKKLRDLGLIAIENRQAKQLPSVYTVLELPGDSQSSALGTHSPIKEDTEKKEGVEANASSGIAKSADSADAIGLEKFVVDGIYRSMDEAGYTLDNSDFGYHLGRAQKMLEKMNPTDAELEGLPGGCVADFEIHSKTDAMSGLRYMRQQKARAARIASDKSLSNQPTNTYGDTKEAREERSRRRTEGYEHLFDDKPRAPITDKAAALARMRGEVADEAGAA